MTTAIGLSAVQAKTLNGYVDLAGAFQTRINKGYDAKTEPSANSAPVGRATRIAARSNPKDFEDGF